VAFLSPRLGGPSARSPRSSRSRNSFRRKLTFSLMTVGLASLCTAGVVYTVCDLWNLRISLDERCALMTERLAYRWQMLEGDPIHSESWSAGLAGDESVRSARLLATDGAVICAYGEPVEESGGAEATAIESFLRPVVRRDVFRAGHPLGTVELVASALPILDRLRFLGEIFLALTGLSTLITLALARRIHHRFSDQLLDLAHAANAISTRRDYSIRAVRRSDDEIGILVDTFNHMITQIELRDHQLKAEVQRAEAARIAKSQFLATMSHEIRTPINGVLGMTQLLLDTRLTEEQTEFAHTIHKSAEGLLSIINDILDFSKGEAGRYEIEAIPFSLSRMVHECLDTVSIVAAEKKLELCLALDERLPHGLIGDPTRLRQILLNLLSNALKFTPQGEIVLRVQHEESAGARVRVRFEVQDTGIGIPPDRIERLFQSFSQLDASRTRKYGGTGLGLAISKQIVEAMGGTMFVKTEEGKGSTFGFKLQLEVEGTLPEPEPVAAPHSLRVLIADPSPTSAEALKKLLQEGNTIEIASDEPSARMLLMEASRADRYFDLLLVDQRLLGAFEALDVIGGERIERAPMVVLSPVNRLSDAAAAGWPGRHCALVKPIKRADLLWCVAELLRGPVPSSSSDSTTRAPDPEPSRDLTVLVAEDHPVNQRITTRFLEKLGVAFVLVSDGAEALHAVKERDFDLVLMDVQMPVLDGLEATLAIRKLEELRGTHVPIVALTANVLEEHRREAHQAGFDDYLSKPVKLEELRAKIQKWTAEQFEESLPA